MQTPLTTWIRKCNSVRQTWEVNVCVGVGVGGQPQGTNLRVEIGKLDNRTTVNATAGCIIQTQELFAILLSPIHVELGSHPNSR